MRLITFDAQHITINNNLIHYSNFLSNLPNYDEDVKLNNKSCTFEIMIKILEFIIAYNDFKEQNTDRDYIIRWNNRFFDVSDEILFKIVDASNFLDIHELFELSCKEVANIIKKCNTPADIRERFNIKSTMTSEEEEEIKSFIVV